MGIGAHKLIFNEKTKLVGDFFELRIAVYMLIRLTLTRLSGIKADFYFISLEKCHAGSK